MQPTRGRYTGTYMSLLNRNVKALSDLHKYLAEHDDLGDEEVHPGMDDLPHGIEQKESDCKDEIERDGVGREILIIVENCFVSTAAPLTILPSLRGWYNGVWPTFTKILDRVNQDLFDLFKSKKNGGNPVFFQKAFDRCHRRNKGQGPFVDKKSKNTLETYTEKLKQNQSQIDRPTMLPSVKASFIIYPEAWAEASGESKFGRCYGFSTSYSENSSSSIHSSSINRSQETYTEKLKQNQSQRDRPTMLPSVKASCIIYPEAWAEASGGSKFGRCYGFGTSYSESSSSSIHSSSINRSQVETENAKNIQELEK
ncbi:hypothetical protein BUALT_Bualt01G0008200 [Buddleja alternifolia]|uniref:Uncharacterized protein n=1 Tax=Buddleja alternifolia TaxID=168488 RepID=A0AAV6Y3H0_9LAMI|nr:hypothetical protein BUALT_Bualt01G0008200 [Buddleja alternifolia]